MAPVKQGVLSRNQAVDLHPQVINLVTLISAEPFMMWTSNKRYIVSEEDRSTGFHTWQGYLDAAWIQSLSPDLVNYRIDTSFEIPRARRKLQITRLEPEQPRILFANRFIRIVTK